MLEHVLNTGTALYQKAGRGEGFMWSFFFGPHWTLFGSEGEEEQDEVQIELASCSPLSPEKPREEKGHKSNQLQSLAGAQTKIAPLFHAVSVLLTKACLRSKPHLL